MPLTLDQIAEQALQLSPESRAELADQLVASLVGADPDLERAWVDEALRRRDEVRAGAVKPIEGEQVMAEVRRAVGR
jgi:putative addiction module component (TIGR02574 family)